MDMRNPPTFPVYRMGVALSCPNMGFPRSIGGVALLGIARLRSLRGYLP